MNGITFFFMDQNQIEIEAFYCLGETTKANFLRKSKNNGIGKGMLRIYKPKKAALTILGTGKIKRKIKNLMDYSYLFSLKDPLYYKVKVTMNFYALHNNI